jgi:hypothetical protein
MLKRNSVGHKSIQIIDSTDRYLAEKLKKKWTSPIYAFYHPVPVIERNNGHFCHVFTCASKSCKYKCCRYLDKSNTNSTGNLCKHARLCWGEEALSAAESAKDVDKARELVVKSILQTGSITASFERTNKQKVTYSNRQHTRIKTW